MATKDKIKVYTNTVGIGTVSLGATASGYFGFSILGTGIIGTYYLINSNVEWEIGSGYYNSTKNTLSRSEIISSSNSNERIALFGESIIQVVDSYTESNNYTGTNFEITDNNFLVGSGNRVIYRALQSSDVISALNYIPYDSNNPKRYLTYSTLPNSIVYDSGRYYNPSWIVSLDPSKVKNKDANWNANRLQGFLISNQIPSGNQVLTWNSSSFRWEPKTVSGFSGGGGGVGGSSITVSLSNTTTVDVDSTPIASGECLKYISHSKYETSVQASEILITRDSNDSYLTEYGVIEPSGKLVSFDVESSGSFTLLKATALNANTTLKLYKIII